MTQFERDQESIQRLISYMTSHSNRNFNIREHANVIFFSTSKLNKVFKEHVGIGPGAYFRRLRIERAIQLQNQTGLSWTEISYLVGYADLPSFSKAFKRVKGVNPKKLSVIRSLT